MAKNYAESYSKALANAYPITLYFGALWSTENTDKYKVIDAKTVKIPHIRTGGRTDGDRDTIGDFSRNWDNDWETKTLTNHREWQTLVHPQDISQTNEVASISNITKTMNETQKFPEMDAYLISTLYNLKNAIETVTTAAAASFTQDTVLTKFDIMMDAMDEAMVPISGRKLYVDTYTKTLIDNARQAYRRTGESIITKTVSRIDEVEIISVPTRLMKTAYTFTNGWAVADGAKQIKMALIHPSCVLPIVSYSFAQLQDPAATTKGKYVYYEESFEDVFILNEKHAGIQMIVCDETVNTLGELDITSTAGTVASGDSVITVDRAAGTDNKFVYKLGTSYTSFDYDSVLSSGWTDLPAGGVVACGTSTKITVAEVVSATSKARARGIATLVKKA